MEIPFNVPYMTGKELAYIKEAHKNKHFSSNGPFTKKCNAWLERTIGSARSFLTHSGTAALEMTAMLAGIKPGDEVIMPSFTFVSTANAFVLRGGVPVFVDIRPDTLNIDEDLIEAAITPKTKAIVVVHYAGVACEMDAIVRIAKKHNLLLIEDAAHGLMSAYKGRTLGSIGDLAVLSFHETKNIICGEGGALLVNDPEMIERAAIISEKGTNRSRFLRGEVDRYSWVDQGSSFLTNDITAAFLWAQMEGSEFITQKRIAIWQLYHQGFEELESQGFLRRPIVPDHCQGNAHIYYLLVKDQSARDHLIAELMARNIHATFHFIPLHDSQGGTKYSWAQGDLAVTRSVSGRIIRFPFWIGIEKNIDRIVSEVYSILTS